MEQKHKLYDIWEEPNTEGPWKVQMNGWVATNPTQAAAERYVETEKALDARGKKQA